MDSSAQLNLPGVKLAALALVPVVLGFSADFSVGSAEMESFESSGSVEVGLSSDMSTVCGVRIGAVAGCFDFLSERVCLVQRNDLLQLNECRPESSDNGR